jgi:hypothetical protein
LVWNTQALINVELEIDFTAWQQQTKVFEITGYIFQQYTCWIPVFWLEYPHYQLWQLIPSAGSGDFYIESSTCEDFVWQSFSTLFNLGGTAVSGVTPARDWFYVIGTPPVEIDYSSNLPQLLEFYLVFNWTMSNQTLNDLFLTTFNAFNGTFFIHEGDKYYMTHISSPYVSWTYDTTPYIDSNGEVILQDGCMPPEYSGLSAGWVLIIVFLVGTFVYCTVGIIYKSVRLHAQGIERMPNNEFWQNLPGLIRDGFWWTIAKITCGSAAKATATYEQIRE